VIGEHAHPLAGSESKPSGPTHDLGEVEEHESEELNGQSNGQTDGQRVRQRFLGDPN
jgi:hypothetical protein